MIKKLKEIADWRYGYQSKKSDTGSVKYLTAKYFDDNSRLTMFEDSYIEAPEQKVLDKFLLKPNDIIITAKGYRIFAWAYDKSCGDCIPSSIFYKLSIDPSIAIGEFVAIQFNNYLIDRYLIEKLTGTTIPTLSSKDLMETPVNLPSLKEQIDMIKLSEIMHKEIDIQSLITEKTKLRNNVLLNKLIKEL